MTILVTLVVLAVIGTGVTGIVRRRVADERSSVRGYQQTLETLRHVADRRAAEASVPKAASAGSGGGRTRSSAPAERNTLLASSTSPGRHPRSSRTGSAKASAVAPVLASRSGSPTISMRAAPLADDDESTTTVADPKGPRRRRGPVARTAADSVRDLAGSTSLHLPRPARPHAPPSPRRGANRAYALGAVAVVALAAAIAAALLSGPSAKPRVSSSTNNSPSASSSHTGPSAAGTGAGSTLTPVTSSATAATYRVPGAPFTLQLAASGSCWVEVNDTATGHVLWAGTMTAGQSQAVPTTAGAVVHLGDAPNIRITIGGRLVALPQGAQAVLALTFLAA